MFRGWVLILDDPARIKNLHISEQYWNMDYYCECHGYDCLLK